MLAEGYHQVQPGWLATIVTHLDMARPDVIKPAILPDDVDLCRVSDMDPDRYLALFRRVGEDWLWSSRLEMPRESLCEILRSPDVELWVLLADGKDMGIVELSFAEERSCELSFLGLSPELTGRGLGPVLMRHAIARAFSRPIDRFWLHTCTHDSPFALGFYRKCGFRPFGREVEVMRDPRVSGLLREDAAPHIPRLSPE